MWECPEFFVLGNKPVLIVNIRNTYFTGLYKDHRFDQQAEGHRAEHVALRGGQRQREQAERAAAEQRVDGERLPRLHHQQPGALFLYVLLLAQLAASVFGCLNLLLESPFLASIYWVILGLGMRVMALL